MPLNKTPEISYVSPGVTDAGADEITGAHAGFGAPDAVYNSISLLPSVKNTCPVGKITMRP